MNKLKNFFDVTMIKFILVDKEIGFVRIYLKPYVQHRDLQVLQRLSHRSHKMASYPEKRT